VDLVRTLAFFCIVGFHDYSAFIYVKYNPELWHHTPMFLMEFLPRVFPYSGFTIVAIYAFLAGLKARPIDLRRPMKFVIPGLLFLMLAYSELHKLDLFWEWDVYHYLVVALFTLAWLSRNRRRTLLFGAIGATFMLFPLWDSFPASRLPVLLRHVLVGVCDVEGRGGWFLLPWIGFPWIFLAMGRLLEGGREVSRREGILWAVPLAAGLFTWGSYFGVDIGPGYYCYIFRQPPPIFWGNFVWFAFYLRISADPRVEAWLAKNRLVQWISALAINRYFGLAYLIQLFWFWLGEASMLPWIGPRASFYAGYLLILPLTEAGTQAVVRIARWRKEKTCA
jgi:hypothetical protein